MKTRIDPRLVAMLERRAQAEGTSIEQLIVSALRICPTCGQPVQTPPRESGKSRGRPADPNSKRQRVLAFMAAHPGASQAECASEIGCTRAYVSQILGEEQGKSG